MRIVLFHPTLLPPKDYGGVERVVIWLAKGLVERGHRVWVAALAGSRLPQGCQLIEVEKKIYSAQDLANLLPKSAEVIHFMAPIAEEIWERLPVPALLTVHGNGQEGERFPKNTVFLSRNHAERHGANAFVYNGIDPEEYCFEPEKKGNWYLFLSKTSWSVKNLSGAIRYCRAAEVSLQIAGGNRPFWSRIACLFSSKRSWIGPVAGEKKAQILAHAKALVFPILWPEPFGLVVAEALISGTPVLASPRGSLTELVPADVGALPTSDAEWVEVLKNGCKEWHPERCRQWALEKFHYSIMAEQYERVYQKLMRGEHLHEVNPVGRSWR